MLFRMAGMVRDSIVDGPGLRLSVFAQGCPHNCPGCHNPHTHDFSGGEERDTEEVVAELKKDPLCAGVTLTGGEPFCQIGAMLIIAKAAHDLGKTVWAYSGWTFEELLAHDERKKLLMECDVLVDGPFVQKSRSLALKFRGSDNQRVIDVTSSIKEGRAVLWRDEWESFSP